jgi:hypothetical protein
MRERRVVRQIVRGDELDVRVIQPGANHISTDAAEAVDSNFDWHESPV